MSTLTRTITVLHRVSGRRYVWADEDTQVIQREVYVDIDTFQDLGEPETITVTIEPGDTLNAEE